MNNIPFEVKRPKIKNICWAILFAGCTAVCIVLLVMDILTVPKTTNTGKAVNCIIFALSAAGGTVFLACMLNCIRNVLSGAVLRLDNDSLTVFRKGTISLHELSKVQVSPKKDRIFFTAENGETISVSQNSLSVPVETVEYAVKCRIEKITKQ